MSNSRRRVQHVIGILLAVVAALLAGGVAAADAQFSVCASGCTHTTIQAAINAAPAGSTISVGAGVYLEQLTIAKPLTLNGADGAVLSGATLGLKKVGVSIKSGNVTFDNIDVVSFSGNGIIVGYEASTPGSLKNVHVTNCRVAGIQPGYSHGFGIYVGYQSEDFKRPQPNPKLTAHLDYSGLLIDGNEVTGSRSSAVVLQSIIGVSGPLLVRNNYIHDNDNDGLWIDSARNISVEGNIVRGNPDGVYLSSYGDAFQGVINGEWVYDWSNQQTDGPYGPMNISMSGNTIADNRTYGGVYLQAGHPSTIAIHDNVITGNAPGVANYLDAPVDMTCNWWGATNGPGPVATGDGDGISANLTFSPWLTSPGGTCNGDATTPPVVTVPDDLTVDATGPGGATVTFAASALDIVDGPITPTCAPSSGSLFPIGVTTVTCSATDRSGNTATSSFLVMVTRPVPTNMNQCKSGGWTFSARANGTLFKNQGDCVSYTNNGK
jgi:parallel beta-helix repeat protein